MTCFAVRAQIAIALLTSSMAGAHANNTADYLTTPIPELQTYIPVLVGKLGLTNFDCGRALLMPSFEPEASTSVYSTASRGVRKYHVTCTSLTANLWQQTDALHDLAKLRAIRVNRIDAELPERTALLVRQVWFRALQRERLRPPKSLSGAMVHDASYAVLSLERANAAPLEGLLNIALAGKKMNRLIDVWNGLYDYARAPVYRRAALATKVDAAAAEFLRTN